MNKLFLPLLIFISIALSGQKAISARVVISGKAPDYAGDKIEFNTLHDFISEKKESLGTCVVKPDGSFELQTELDRIRLGFADFDGYHCMLYLEPGKNYQILLPPKRKLTAAQKRNPFVKPDPIWLGIENPQNDELNFRIQEFEQKYLAYENKYFNEVFVNQSGKLVDSVKNELNREFPKTDQKFFEAHKFFRIGNLEFALNQGRSAEFMKTYFSTTKPVYDLNAYATLFDQEFTNYFTTLTTSLHQSAVAQFINHAELDKLDEYFQKQLHFNAALSHWVLLKAMKDAYYTKLFSKTSILKLLDQVVQNSGWSEYEKETAQFIRHDLTYLTSGTTPPEISLKSLDGKVVSLSNYKGSYIYLHFTDPKNIVCAQHLDALKKIADHYNKEKLVIINVIPQNQEFKNDRGWPGIFTTSGDALAETYKVKTYPTSFLISKEGKLLLSPAPNPIDGLDRQLGQIFKSDYLKQMQKSKATDFK